MLFGIDMVRRRVTIYAMLTLEHQMQINVESRFRCGARIAVGLPLDSLEPEKDEQQKE